MKQMTDNELAKKFEEAYGSFNEMCHSHLVCDDCEMRPFAQHGLCAYAWVWQRMKEEEEAAAAPNESPKAKEEEKPATADKMSAVQLPKWCKVGQWVVINDTLCKIAEVHGDTYYPFTVKDVHGVYMFAHPRVMYPVKFRPHTFEEAVKLLGKQMEYFSGSRKYKHLMTITEVSESEDGCHINGYPHTYWSNRNATIDGVPFGVPEVDEEAMEGGEKCHE